MSHTLTLGCGCVVYVSCHPKTNVAHSRIIERRGPSCGNRKHAIGVRLWLWEVLPDPTEEGFILEGPGPVGEQGAGLPPRRSDGRSPSRFEESAFDD